MARRAVVQQRRGFIVHRNRGLASRGVDGAEQAVVAITRILALDAQNLVDTRLRLTFRGSFIFGIQLNFVGARHCRKLKLIKLHRFSNRVPFGLVYVTGVLARNGNGRK